MLTYPQIDPVLLDLGPVQIHWYGVMYLIAFSLAWWLSLLRARRPGSPLREEQLADLIFYGALGAVLGGRLGYVLFYNFSVYLADPLALFKVWEGGMSFHGGFLGVLAAMAWYGRQQKLAFFTLTDFIAPAVPLGLLMGRLGNFINAELWGQTTTLPWGMVFPGAGPLPRHPSQLYEGFLEGLLLFAILWWFARQTRPRMAISAVFLIAYGSFRFAVEFVREPDAHIGYLAFDWLTMGHVLSLPMVLAGLLMLWWAYRRPRYDFVDFAEKKANST